MLVNGRPIHIKRRLNRALLFYLAGQRQPITRDEVIAAFWPEGSEESGRKNLREALSRLRTDLGVKDIILSVNDQLSINPELVEVDYREFDRIITPLLGSTEMTGSASLPEWMVLQLKAALEMCRSNQLLQGVRLLNAQGFENWLQLDNQAYTFARLKAIDRLADHYLTSGDLDQAILWLGRGLEINRFDEDMNFLMLICLRDLGKTQEIINYVNYLEGLYNEMQEPLSERLAEIRHNAQNSKGISLTEGGKWPEVKAGEPRFVGREKYLAEIANVLHRRGILLLRGETGAGKTRLLKEFFIQQSVIPRLIYVRSDSLCEHVAFYALIKAVREQVLPTEWEELEEQDKQILSGFYHNTWQGLTGTQIPTTPDQWLPVFEDVFFAFLRLMTIIAARRPILFILDDSKWLDLASISLVTFLIEQKYFEKHGLLAIVTQERNENQPLEEMIQMVNRSGKLVTIDLEPLNREEIALFVNNILGRLPGEDFVESIQRLSGGNPTYVIECLRSAELKADLLEVLKRENCDPPESLVNQLQKKASFLTENAGKLLRAGSILGHEFTPAALAAMKILDGEDLLSGLEELVETGFIHPVLKTGISGGYRFSKEIERIIVISQISLARKRDLHLRAANALQIHQESASSTSAEIASHYEASGEYSRAIEAWVSAGRYARSIFSREDTYRAYGKALDLIKTAPRSFDEELIYTAINEWGNYAYDQDDMPACEMVYGNSLEIGAARHSALLTGLGYSGIGRVGYYTNDFRGAEEAFHESIYYLSQTGNKAARINALSALGYIRFGLDDYMEALALLEEALQLVEGETDPESVEARINIITYICAMLCFTGNITRANDLAVHAVRDSIRVNRRLSRLQAYIIWAMTEYFRGNYQKTLQICEENDEFANKLQVRFWSSLKDLLQAMSYLAIGNLDASWNFLAQVEDRQKNYPTEKIAMHAWKVKGDFFRMLGERDKAAQYYRELISDPARNFTTIDSRFTLGTMLLSDGNAEGMVWLMEAIREADEQHLAGIALRARTVKAFSLATSDTLETFELECRSLMEKIKESGLYVFLSEEMISAHSAGLRQDADRVLSLTLEMLETRHSYNNIWEELYLLNRVLNLNGRENKDNRKIRERIKELIKQLAANAMTPVARNALQKYRKKRGEYVNVVSMP